MLELHVAESQFYDEATKKLVRLPAVSLRLEHSLLSLSKWESEWEIPFLSQTKKTPKQLYSYVAMMSQEPVDQKVLAALTTENFDQINEYLTAKHSATWFSDDDQKAGARQTVTSELIYYWMTALNIPYTCETWPLQRLLNLIKIAQIKAEAADPKRKGRPKAQMLSERAALNMKRRNQMNSEG